MNTKITFPELINLLFAQSGQQKKVCEAFLKEFFAAVSESLVAGEAVKIRNFGTFKLTEIDPRKSVNVNDGREIEIPGHRRVSFTPAKNLAERINEPFEAFESVELADEVTDDVLSAFDNEDFTFVDDAPADNTASGDNDTINDSTATQKPYFSDSQVEEAAEENHSDETVSIENASGISTLSNEPAPFEFVADPVNADASSYNYEDEEDMPPVSEPAIGETARQPAPETQHPHIGPASQPTSDDTMAESASVETPVSPDSSANSSSQKESSAVAVEEKAAGKNGSAEQPKRKPRQFGMGFVSGMLTCLFIAVVGMACWYYYNGEHDHQLLAQSDTGDKKDTGPAIQDTAFPDTATTVAQDTILPVKEGEKLDETEEESLEKEEPATEPSDAPVYDKITKTRYLTTMAKDHYGSYHFWPYIYQANPGLGDPDRIRPGTKIKIPSLATIGANPKNPADVKSAKALGAKIYSRYGK